MGTKKWPHHEGQVEFRSEDYRLYERYGVGKADIHKFGLLSYIIRGFLVKEIYNDMLKNPWKYTGKLVPMPEYEWLGGCGPNRKASLDVRISIPSQKILKNNKKYDMFLKLISPDDDSIYQILGNVVPTDDCQGNGIIHSCESAGFHGVIQRFTPCKHFIAAQLILQERSERWCNEHEEEWYHGLNVAEVYRNEKGLPLQVFGAIPKAVMEIYKLGTKQMNNGNLNSIGREAAVLHAAAKWKYKNNLLDATQKATIESILLENGDSIARTSSLLK